MSMKLPEWLKTATDGETTIDGVARQAALATIEQIDKLFEEDDFPFWAITMELKKHLVVC